jgi:hypothetical protein
MAVFPARAVQQRLCAAIFYILLKTAGAARNPEPRPQDGVG